LLPNREFAQPASIVAITVNTRSEFFETVIFLLSSSHDCAVKIRTKERHDG